MSFETINNEEEGEVKDKYGPAEILKARKQADLLLDKFYFNKEEITEINPENLKDEVPIIVSPGWGIESPAKSMRETLETLADQGRKVITTAFSREEKIMDREDEEIIPIAQLQKALTIVGAIKKKGIDKADAIGHSEGGINLAIAAILYPEMFRNLVFIAPAGMIGEDSYLDLVKRFTIDEGIEELKNREKSNINSFYEYMKRIVSYISKNPTLAYKETKALTSVDIFEMTKHLKDQGIGVGLICGVEDQVFPIEQVLENVDKENIDHFLTTKGNHGSFVFDEEHVLLAENLLDNMSKGKK